jgi:hypothetical protein
MGEKPGSEGSFERSEAAITLLFHRKEFHPSINERTAQQVQCQASAPPYVAIMHQVLPS